MINNEYDGISGFMTQELFLKVTEAVESLLPRICTPGEPTPFRKIVEAILAEPEFAGGFFLCSRYTITSLY
jgi:hypothetical protein